MNNNKKTGLIEGAIIGLIVVIVAVGIFYKFPAEQSVKGLIADSFTSKVLTSANASSTKGVIIRGGASIIHTITIASSSPSVSLGLRVYDGMATSSTDLTATSSGTLLMTIRPSAAEVTLTFDSTANKGIVVDVPPGYNGSVVVTTK